MRRILMAGLLACMGLCALPPPTRWPLPGLPPGRSKPSPTRAPSTGSAAEPGHNEPGYLIQAHNVGGAPVSGEFTVTDYLPKGLLPAPGYPPRASTGARRGKPGSSK